MKTKGVIFAAALLGLFTWSCTSTDDLSSSNSDLKNTISANASNLNSAINTITSSAGYQALTGTSGLRSTTDSPLDTTLTNSILLTDIKGLYDYKANYIKRGPSSILRFFTKTADSSIMVVRLPEEKVKNFKVLLAKLPGDSSLTNNYVVSLNDYQYRFNRFAGWDYKMGSSINIKGVESGVLKIASSNSKANGYKYYSEFVFPNGYTTTCTYTSGDTAVSAYSIAKGGTVLYEEKYTAIRGTKEVRHREKSFSLIIGNVQIVRNSGGGGLDSAKVYVSGVLQANAKVSVVDKSTDGTDVTVTNKKRELQITFEDGTVSTFSQLAGAAIDNIGSLFTAMRNVTFTTNVIDWIAWDIYTKK